MINRWEKAKEADGQVTLLLGIPGVGKLLIRELRLNVQNEPHFFLHYQCSPYHTQSAFFPIIEQTEQDLQLRGCPSDADKLTKIRAHFPRSADDTIELALLIANLLSIPTKNDCELSQFTSQQIKNRTISKVIDMVLALSAKRPTLCIFEDVHWIDHSSLQLLELMMSRIDHARVLLIVSYRPEFRHAWPNYANVTMHSLTRLSRSEVSGMVKDLFRGRSIPHPILSEIIDKTDGVPLFIEELTSSIVSDSRTTQPTLLRVRTRCMMH